MAFVATLATDGLVLATNMPSICSTLSSTYSDASTSSLVGPADESREAAEFQKAWPQASKLLEAYEPNQDCDSFL
ncbi:hypothetical protein CPB85DRAFT_1289528 [Mucidula mucida]|nr:hypothetical protein CPB85DRAFT_1289528 [Mucidula mucida]